jgi:hypothetical protein
VVEEKGFFMVERDRGEREIAIVEEMAWREMRKERKMGLEEGF